LNTLYTLIFSSACLVICKSYKSNNCIDVQCCQWTVILGDILSLQCLLSSHVMPFHSFRNLQLIMFFVVAISLCMLALVSLIPPPPNTVSLFKGMELTFSSCSHPFFYPFSKLPTKESSHKCLFFFPFSLLPTKESSHKFLFFFLLFIFPNGDNASKSIVDRASQQGGNARPHPVDDKV